MATRMIGLATAAFVVGGLIGAVAACFVEPVVPPALAAPRDPLEARKASFRRPAEVPFPADNPFSEAKRALGGFDDARMAGMWRLQSGGKDILAMPRAAFVRAIMLNHWYHHRGQLLVYLRLLNQSVPSVYGPTADENPFAAGMTAAGAKVGSA